MLRALVLIFVISVLGYIFRRVWVAIMQLRVGAIPDDVDVPEVTMEVDRGWQVTRKVEHGIATINVEHPAEGIARTWTVRLREPGASRQLEEYMHRAGVLAHELTTTANKKDY